MKYLYRKLLLISIILITNVNIYATTLRIMSFNLQGSDKKSNIIYDTKWCDEIIAILKDSSAKADIILFQEISIPYEKIPGNEYFGRAKTNNALDYIVKKMNGYQGSWKYLTTAEYQLRKKKEVNGNTYNNCTANQTNAILYNSQKLTARDCAKDFGFDSFSGKYLFDKNNVQIVEFKINQSKEKFYTINVHAPYNSDDKYNTYLNTLEQLYASLKLKNAVVIGGDFNTIRQTLTYRNFDNVDGTDSWYYDKNFGLLTTISDDKKSFRFANQYDHFIFSKKVNVVQNMKRVGANDKKDSYKSISIGKHTYYNSNEYKNLISDHFPIIIEVEINN